MKPAGLLAAAGVRPRKSKGQNFLVQPRVADRIIEAAEIAAGDNVIEIGPGLGILSELIARRPVNQLILIELDARLARQLQERFANDARIVIINRDFLGLAPADYLDPSPPSNVPADRSDRPLPTHVKIVANLPFNVAAAILERLSAVQARIARMVLMFQREVAERIRSRPGMANHGALSVYTAMYWGIAGHFRVAAGSFHPRPKVDAEVLTFVPRRPPPFAPDEEQPVLATVRAAFSAPRKMLRNTIGRALAIEPGRLEAAFERAAIDPAQRAAALVPEDFVRLARALRCDCGSGNRRDA